MSWQCPYCETVNQDAVPYCTVCDRIAPVIESFLSLEQIENVGLYNDKLDEVHQHEYKGEYEEMLTSALEAIRLYKENDLAVTKVQVAVKRMLEKDMVCELIKLIEKSLGNNDFPSALNIVGLWETLQPKDEIIESYKSKISEAEEKERKFKAEENQVKPKGAKKIRRFPRPTRTNAEDIVEVAKPETKSEKSNGRKYPKVKRNT